MSLHKVMFPGATDRFIGINTYTLWRGQWRRRAMGKETVTWSEVRLWVGSVMRLEQGSG